LRRALRDGASFEGADEEDGASSFAEDDEADGASSFVGDDDDVANEASFAVDDEPDENASSFAGADEADEAESAGMMPLSISLYLSKSSFSSSERFSLISLKSVA
jgi:hypothetical protein